MRIGNVIIDTDNMTADEVSTIIRELREIRSRKIEQESLINGMKELLQRAADNNFYFTADFNVLRPSEIQIWEEPELH